MSQLAASEGQPGNWEEPGFFLRRLETVRFQEDGWQEPCESRGSRTVLRGTGGETPPVYPTHQLTSNYVSIISLQTVRLLKLNLQRTLTSSPTLSDIQIHLLSEI